MMQQAEKFGWEIKFPEEVLELNLELNLNGIVKSAVTRHSKYRCYSVIIATGTQRRKLTVPGEVEFLGRGVFYFAVCDAPFFRDKTVAVVGFNNMRPWKRCC